MSNASNNSEGKDISDELGHLYLVPQSKSRYVSPDFFAMISQEVRLIYILSVGSLLTLCRSQKSIIYSSSNSNTLLIPSSMFCGRSKITHCKMDHIGYHTISPLFHGPSFLQQARRYFERYLRSFAWRFKSTSCEQYTNSCPGPICQGLMSTYTL
jgi:hypothetical protein